MDGRVRVLHVDDDAEFRELSAAALERADDALAVETAPDAETALERLADGSFDCVVSDYRMPGLDGIELLERVRETRPDLPFVLFTGEGSEAVASDAISAGVTDYLQKETGTAQYEVLANRVRNAVERRRTAREVERLGRLFESLYDNPLVFAAVLAPDGTVRSVNETVADAAGADAAACEGRPFAEMPWWTDDAPVADHVARAAAGETTRFRAGFEAPEGVRTALTVLIPVAGGDAVLAVGQDVTEAGDYLRDALDALEELFFLFDADGGLREWNDAVTWVTGYESAALRSMSPADFVVPEDREAVTDALDRVATEGHATVRVRLQTADGDAIPYAFRASRISATAGPTPDIVGIGYDLRERERREAALERLHAVTRTLLRADTEAAVAGVVADAVDDVLGYGSTVVRLADDEGRLEPVSVTRLARTEMGERPVYEADEAPPGEAFAAGETTVYEDVSTVDDGHDRGDARAGLFVPIGDHGVVSVVDTDPGTFGPEEVRLAETLAANAAVALDRLAEARARREETERLEEFAGVVTHDLRTPLTTASGWLAEVRRENDDDRLGRVADALDRAEAIVEDLATLTRSDRVAARDRVDLADLVADCWSTVADEDARLRVETDRVVEADEGLLARLVENLLRNAVEHGSTGNQSPADSGDAVEHGSTGNRNAARSGDAVEHGSTGNQSPADSGDAPEHAAPAARSDRAVTVTVGDTADGFYVADDGPGLAADERDRVFERGYSRGGGSGLGLRIVERAAEAHGWSVRARESEAGGARFEVRL